MRTMRPVHDEQCSVACTADIIGAKWTAVIVHDLSEGPRRFSELERSCPGISPRTLSERLRALGLSRRVAEVALLAAAGLLQREIAERQGSTSGRSRRSSPRLASGSAVAARPRSR